MLSVLKRRFLIRLPETEMYHQADECRVLLFSVASKEGCKNSLQKGDRFSVPLFTRVGARYAACGFGFGWAAGLVSVTVWLQFLLRVALVAVTAAETEFPLRSKWFPLHPAPCVTDPELYLS